MKYLNTLLVLAVLFGATDTLSAIVINVPGDQPNIQAGIDAVGSGDTVLVADGTYIGTGNKNLNFSGKIISVLSSSGNPAACVIDCENDGRGFIFESNETNSAVLSGFTIQNGYLTGEEEYGGGILCFYSSPTIRNCILTNNHVASSGGAIGYYYSTLVIADCIITGNSAVGGGGIHGGGPANGSAIIINCRITNNDVSSYAGGIFLMAHDVLVTDCLISGNAGGYHGGGIYSSTTSNSIISNCRITDNTNLSQGGGVLSQGYERYENCIITENSAYDGGGIYIDDMSDETIFRNCTVALNTAGNRGGGVYASDLNSTASSNLKNCVIWSNQAEIANDEIYDHAGILTVSYSDVRFGWPGDGNIDADPLFIAGPDGSFYLSQIAAGQSVDSPCLDTGSDPAENICFPFPENQYCLSNMTTRTDNLEDAGIVDMGFHYLVCRNHGDLNFDGEITSEDAQWTFMIVMGTFAYSVQQECAADCNGDGEITAGDAQQVFLTVLGLGMCVDQL